MSTSLAYVGLCSPNAQAWVDFARDVLGAAAEAHGDTVAVRLDDRPFRIAVHRGDADALAYLGWEVGSAAELATVTARLTSLGLTIRPGTDDERANRAVDDLVVAEDPAGFRVEIVIGAHRDVPAGGPARFVTGEMGFGHVVLIVPDRDSYERYLIEGLGLSLTDTITARGVEPRFYGGTPRHHSIAIVGIPGMRGVDHVMVEVDDIDQVGRALDAAEAAGVVRTTLGRHVNDRMLSFYVNTPSAVSIEYGWGGRQVSDRTSPDTYTDASVWGHRILGEAVGGIIEPVS